MNVPIEVAKLVKENEELSGRLAAAEQTAKTADATIADLEGKFNVSETALAVEKALTVDFDKKVIQLGVDLDAQKLLTVEADNKVLDLTSQLSAATIKIDELSKVAEEAQTSADALAEVVVDAVETKTAVTDQLEVLVTALGTKGAIPDIVETDVVIPNAESALHAKWVKLSKGSPAERIAARKIYNANKAVLDAEVDKRTASELATEAVSISDADKSIFDTWTDIRLRAKEALTITGKVAPSERTKVHTQLTIEARKFYNKPENQAAIDRVLAGGDNSSMAKTA